MCVCVCVCVSVCVCGERERERLAHPQLTNANNKSPSSVRAYLQQVCKLIEFVCEMFMCACC